MASVMSFNYSAQYGISDWPPLRHVSVVDGCTSEFLPLSTTEPRLAAVGSVVVF
jgi:hypothetical protein